MEGAKMNVNARPACLHTQFQINNNFCLASGWGRKGFTEETSKELLKVKLELFSLDRCNASYKSDAGGKKLLRGIDDSTQVCAGSSVDLKDTCQVRDKIS